MILSTDFNEFQKLIEEHERIIAEIIEKEPVKQHLFNDYPYALKSLLACGDSQTPEYFKNKGYPTVINYLDLIY